MNYSLKTIGLAEIPLIIREASPFGGKILQSSLELIKSTQILWVQFDSHGFMFFKLAGEKITKKVPLSVKLNYRNLIFKIFPEQYEVADDILITRLPQSAKALPRRPDERYIIPMNNEVHTFIQRIEKRGMRLDQNVQILDVSERGLGILISDACDDLLLTHDHLWIKSLDNIQLDNPLFGRVVYSHQRKFKDGIIDIKAGISLSAPIPKETLGQLRGHSHLVLQS